MKILITGGAGFIGSHLAGGYLSAGHDVTVVDNFSTGRQQNLPAEATSFCVDITDYEALEQVFARVQPDVISHHAAQMDIRRSLREPLFDATVNVLGSLSVLELSVRYGVKKVIFASSGGAIYGEAVTLPATESTAELPISHYGVTKLTVERYLNTYHHLYGLNFTVLRYANVFGPRQNPHGEAGVVAIFIGQMLRNEVPTIFGDGSKTRDYVFVEDVVAANIVALEKGNGGVFNIGCGIQVSDYEVFETIRENIGYISEPIFAPRRAGEVVNSVLDPSVASRVLGWRSTVRFAEGITRTIAHIRAESDANGAFVYGAHRAKKKALTLGASASKS